MSDPVALALIAAAAGIGGQVVLTWRAIVVAKETKDEAARAAAAALEAARLAANVLKETQTVSDKVNGKLAMSLQKIAELEAEVIRLNQAAR